MQSTSAHSISWTRPDITEEMWEYSSHPAKQGFYQDHAIDWDRLLAAAECGRFVPYPRSDLIKGIPVALSYDSYDDYARYLAKAKRGYRRSYAKMEEVLQREGTLVLPAPIIILSDREALLFSGYRRLCLAWNYGMVPFVWLITVR